MKAEGTPLAKSDRITEAEGLRLAKKLAKEGKIKAYWEGLNKGYEIGKAS